MQRLAIDMDEVMADTLAHYLHRYNSEFGGSIKKADLQGKRPFDTLPLAHREQVMTYFQDPEFFANIPLMEGSQEAVAKLAKRYEIFITTAAMDVPCSFTPKFRWLARHFPEIQPSHIVFCGDKSIIAADYLLDDNLRHLENFRGEGILFTAPHNIHETRFRRADTWQDVERLLL